MEDRSSTKVKVTGHEEGHFDIGHMHVQVLRSTFWLLTLAVTILVIFSSVALLRNPSNRPVVNVFLSKAPSDTDSDQSERLKRGVGVSDKHSHVHLKRELLFEGKKSGQMKTGGVKSDIAFHGKNKNIHNMKKNGNNSGKRGKVKKKTIKERRLNNTQTDVKEIHNPGLNRKKEEKPDKTAKFRQDKNILEI